MIQALRLLVIAAPLMLSACEGFDPWPGVGEGLKNLCRSHSNCSVHDSDSSGR
jgi:hypothetical protein